MASTGELLQKGINAAKAKQIAEARSILEQVVELEPRNEAAWLWLSGVVETDAQRITCLENVLAINPDNKAAQRGLSILKQKAAAVKPLPEAVERPAPLKTPVTTRPSVPLPSQATAKPKRKLSRTTIGCSVTIVLLLVANVILVLIIDNPFHKSGPPAISTPMPVPLQLSEALQGWSRGGVLSVEQRTGYLYVEFEFVQCASDPNNIDCSISDVQGMLWTLFDEYEGGRYAQDTQFCALDGESIVYTIRIGYNKCRSQNDCAVYEEADVLKAATDFHISPPYYTDFD